MTHIQSLAVHEKKYTAPAIALHWLIAALIICGFSLGWVMTGILAFHHSNFNTTHGISGLASPYSYSPCCASCGASPSPRLLCRARWPLAAPRRLFHACPALFIDARDSIVRLSDEPGCRKARRLSSSYSPAAAD